jgi:S1-C subfamily serine protease
VNVVDVIVLLGVVLAVVSGVRAGLIGMTASAVGTIVGFFVGSWIATELVGALDLQGLGEVLLATFVLASCVALASFAVQLAAVPLGTAVHRIQLGWLDQIFGGALAFVVAVVIAWLLGGVLAAGPSQSVARAMQDSAVLRALDDRLPAAPGVVAELQQAMREHGMPSPFVGFEPRLDPVTPPSTAALAAAQRAAAASTVRVSGEGCGGGIVGSGAVVAPGVVVTNAHVVAGTHHVRVEATDGAHDAVPVLFDPDTDLAVLHVQGLDVPVLPIASQDAGRGQGAAVLGYPGGGPLEITSAAVLDAQQALGRNIWGGGVVRREVYVLQASVRPGDSGGPFVDTNGTVLGLVFARSNVNSGVGYALTSDELRDALAAAPSAANAPAVDTRSCAK